MELDQNDLGGTLEKVAEYIRVTQPALDRHNALMQRFTKRATQVSGVLVDRGIIPAEKSDLFLQKIAEDPVKALDMVVKLAHLVGPDEMGSAASDEVKRASANDIKDPFDRLVIYGDAAATGDRFDGMVE